MTVAQHPVRVRSKLRDQIIEVFNRGRWCVNGVAHDVRMAMRHDDEIASGEPYPLNHPFDVEPALSSCNHMEAGGVSAWHTKPPRRVHCRAAIKGALNMHGPKHIRQDIFR